MIGTILGHRADHPIGKILGKQIGPIK